MNSGLIQNSKFKIQNSQPGFTPTPIMASCLVFFQKVRTYFGYALLLYAKSVSHKSIKKQRHNWCGGFTFIEFLVYIAILSVVLSAFVEFHIAISESRSKYYVVGEVHAGGRVALDILSQKIRSATAINISSSVFDTDPGVLSLSMSDPGKDPTIFDLNQDDGILRITEGGANPVDLIDDETKITNLVFTNLSSGSTIENVGVQITVDYNTPTGARSEYVYSKSFSTSVSLRQ